MPSHFHEDFSISSLRNSCRMNTQINTKHITQYLDDQEESMLDFVKGLATIESPSTSPKSQEPILAILADHFRSIDYLPFRIRGNMTGGSLFVRPRSRLKLRPIQLLIGHSDTVWNIGTLTKMPIHHKDDRLSGPGVYDMKAGLTQIFYALKTIQKNNLKCALTPIVLINSDEEIGSRESSKIIKRLAKISKRAFIMEPPLGLEGKLKTARKGLGRFTLHITGEAAHSGLDPGKGASAIIELANQIQKLFALNDPDRGVTVNVGMIEGGVSANVIAPTSKAVIEVRVLNQEDGEQITRAIKGLQPTLSGTKLSIEGGMGRPPMEPTARNQQLWEMAREVGLQLGLVLEQGVAGGGSDGNTTSQFTATLDGLGTPGDGAHAAHEYIYTHALKERTALLTLLLLQP